MKFRILSMKTITYQLEKIELIKFKKTVEKSDTVYSYNIISNFHSPNVIYSGKIFKFKVLRSFNKRKFHKIKRLNILLLISVVNALHLHIFYIIIFYTNLLRILFILRNCLLRKDLLLWLKK